MLSIILQQQYGFWEKFFLENPFFGTAIIISVICLITLIVYLFFKNLP